MVVSPQLTLAKSKLVEQLRKLAVPTACVYRLMEWMYIAQNPQTPTPNALRTADDQIVDTILDIV